jgi:exodeoxyribonuclease VII small subunit
MTKIPDDIKKLSFEKALGELEEIVDNLESGSVDLEQSIGHYTRGSLLRLHCQNKLDEAVLKLEEIKVSPDGKVSKNKANET